MYSTLPMAAAAKKKIEELWFQTEAGLEFCDICDGTGLQTGQRCKECNGSGRIDEPEEKKQYGES